MDRRSLITVAAAAAATGAVPATAHAASGHTALVGSWLGTVTAVSPPLGSFNDLISFHTGGVVTESRRYLVPDTPFGPLLETTGHGAWEARGHTVEAFFRFLLQRQADGAPVGTDNIRLRLALEGGQLTGTFQSQIKDLDGNVLFEVTGTYAATPITV